MNAQLLIAKWREDADDNSAYGDLLRAGKAVAFAECADELEAALAAPKEAGDYLLREIDRALNGDVLAVLMDVQNGIDSPGLAGMANSAIRRLEYVKELAARLAAPSKEAGPDFDALAYRFLAWPLAASVCADPCASMQNYPNRTGTNLLSFVEAKAMLQHVLTTPCPIDGLTEPHVGMDPPHQYTANPPGDQRQEGEIARGLGGIAADLASKQESGWPVPDSIIEYDSPPPEAAAPDFDDGGPYNGIDWRASYETAQAEIADLRRRLAALASPTGPQPAGGGVDDGRS